MLLPCKQKFVLNDETAEKSVLSPSDAVYNNFHYASKFFHIYSFHKFACKYSNE